MNLLSANDFDHLKNAMLRHEEIVLYRRLNDFQMTAKTLRASSPWPGDMIVQIRKEHGNVVWIKNFQSVDDAISACK